ncbi:hypothetical protein [Thiorhodococcus fuscus]|uniref:Uncharacterized protein n=1 Tax=Thiorhodococcus fuscus TaxID=527200 RepID=A0ABW4Y9S8_9GAMM
MFAKSTLASAVAAAIGVSAVGIAQADSVFFPQVVLSDTVTTIASVINTTASNWDNAGNVSTTHLHYRFYYKAGVNASDATASCEEYDEYLPTSIGDIQTIDLSGHFGADTLGVLFNDPSINNNWAATNRDYAFGRNVAPARGYLYVDNSANSGNTLGGEAFVFEFGSGAAWGYQAYNTNNANYAWAASASPSLVPLMPFGEITTAFFVTPVSVDQAPDVANDYRARVEFFTSMQRGDVYDRDENLISGTVPQDVVCVARIDAMDLLSDGAMARIADGGWARLLNYRLTSNSSTASPANINATATDDAASLSAAATKLTADDGAVVIKLEYNIGGTFNGESVGGTYNNAIIYQP